MTTRIVMIDYVIPTYNTKGDECGRCPRLMPKAQLVSCRHFGPLALRPGTKRIYLRHANCIRAEERAGHASISALMQKGDFDDV
jgi:hypothetical protein